eukprot:TRINITY_DN12671_c0_g1_i1.p1 TRINITY_DN12671_c0_g1~~TRINITY_DN12671_c0_g1_i1.p1  ORF type:complete len:614 (+),score=146.64 TRINITY_DN12671_c0_g1_i1:84-1844(+)
MPGKKHGSSAALSTPRVSPRGMLENRVRANLLANEEGEALCFQVMEDIVARAEAQVISNHFDRTAIPYTVQNVAKELMDLMQLVFLARDDGGGDPADGGDSWAQDAEPDPIPADPWARGVVPLRATREPDPLERPQAAKRNRSTVPQGYSSFRQDPVPKSPRAQGAPPPASGDAAVNTPATVPGQGKGLPPLKRPQAALSASDPAAAERRHSGLTDGGNRADLRRRQEMREAAERQNRLLRESKQKAVCVDSINGRVIPSRSVHIERLPNRRVDMQYQVEGERAPVQPVTETKRHRGAPRAGGTQRKGKAAGDGQPRIKWSDFVEPEEHYGPLCDPCTPVGGVLVKEGTRIARAGLKVNEKRMTTDTFRKLMQAQGGHRPSADMLGSGGFGASDLGSSSPAASTPLQGHPAQPRGAAGGRSSPQTPLQGQHQRPGGGGGGGAGAPRRSVAGQQQQQQRAPPAAATAAAAADPSVRAEKQPERVQPQAVPPRPQFRPSADEQRQRGKKPQRQGSPRARPLSPAAGGLSSDEEGAARRTPRPARIRLHSHNQYDEAASDFLYSLTEEGREQERDMALSADIGGQFDKP